jgi:hypothetical protein
MKNDNEATGSRSMFCGEATGAQSMSMSSNNGGRFAPAVEHGREAAMAYMRAWSPSNLINPVQAMENTLTIVRESWACQRAVLEGLFNRS